jgi:hypothetical protein
MNPALREMNRDAALSQERRPLADETLAVQATD